MHRGTGQVLKVVSGGEPGWTPLPVAIGLAAPEGIAVAPDGSLLVIEAEGGRLSRIAVGSAEAEPVVTGLAVGLAGPLTAPPVWIFSDVTVTPDGVAYVSGDRDNVVYRIPLDR